MPLRLASSISSVGQWVASTKRDPMVVVAEGMVVVDMEGMAGTRAMAMVVNNSSSMETLEVGFHVA